MKKIITVAAILFVSILQTTAYSQAKIKAYFNNPVNNTVSTGVNAVYLPSGTMADTIIAYINQARQTIDIAQYDYNQDSYSGAYSNIAAAVDSAYSRGVIVRWIYDGGESNSGLAALNPGIHTLARPASTSAIMHNKFIVIDANTGNPDDAIVSTGSADWSSEMFRRDYNNILFIQDSALAYAYTAEFNMMWGSTTPIPNASLAKFGTAKTDLGLHTFTIGGNTVELYFSPSDGTDAHVASSILTANKDLYVGVYDMTRTGDANDMVTVKNRGVYTLAILDQYSTTPAPTAVNTILSSGLGANYVVYHGSVIYHNKMMIVDPSDTCSDPLVLTGSYNWTTSATSYNDENILIIHNDTLANIYYQSFIANFTAIGGGTFVAPNGICGGSMATLSIPSTGNAEQMAIYPNPADNELTVTSAEMIRGITISNVLGRQVYCKSYDAAQVGIDISGLAKGVYFLKVNGTEVRKFVKQ